MHIESVIASREQTHGDYRTQAALAQCLKRMLRETRNWEVLDFYQAQSLEAFCDKVSRILNGDINEIDHWQDISGYATLVLKELTNDLKPQPAKAPTMKPDPADKPLEAPAFLLKQMEEDLQNEIDKK